MGLFSGHRRLPGPTAFQLPVSNARQVLPPSMEMSEPFVPTATTVPLVT